MVQTETYLGGVAGGSLSRKGFGLAGYEIHAADRRIFGVRALKHLPGVYGSLVSGDMHPVHGVSPADKQPTFIQELERKKDFEVSKEEIRELLIVKPGWIYNGYLMISRNSGDQIMVRIRGRKAWLMVADLMGKFYPQVVKNQ